MRGPQCRWVDNGYRISGDLRDCRFGINFIPCSKCWSEVARALKHDPGLHTIYDPTRLLRLVVAKASPCGPGCTMAPNFLTVSGSLSRTRPCGHNGLVRAAGVPLPSGTLLATPRAMGNNPAHGHAVARHADRPRGARRHRRAGDIPQRGHRFLRIACEGARAPRSRHHCRPRRYDLRRRMDHGPTDLAIPELGVPRQLAARTSRPFRSSDRLDQHLRTGGSRAPVLRFVFPD